MSGSLFYPESVIMTFEGFVYSLLNTEDIQKIYNGGPWHTKNCDVHFWCGWCGCGGCFAVLFVSVAAVGFGGLTGVRLEKAVEERYIGEPET